MTLSPADKTPGFLIVPRGTIQKNMRDRFKMFHVEHFEMSQLYIKWFFAIFLNNSNGNILKIKNKEGKYEDHFTCKSEGRCREDHYSS